MFWSEMMEEQSLMSLNPFLPALSLGSCPPTITTNNANCFLFPDTPPLTPAINGLVTSASVPSYGGNSSMATSSQPNFTSSVLITPRTPRKPANPCHLALSSVNREKSAIISFKMVHDGSAESPSLSITSRAPCKRRLTGARRRLWVHQGESSERFDLETSDCVSSKEEFKGFPSKLPILYGDGIEADDEMDGKSASSSISPPYSPSYGGMVCEAPAKPAFSSSSYLMQTHHNHRHLFIHTTSKQRAYSPKIKPTHKSKTCASCKTKKTPLWRDSEDGISYCNACGIRFKKYRVRCSSCQYIPRKDEREMSKQCCRCGAPLMHCKIYGR